MKIYKILNDAVKKYVNDIIGQYANKLIAEVGKIYNRSALFRMKQFYNLFGKPNSEQKVSTMWTKLPWSHIRELLPLKDINNYILNINTIFML